MPTTYRFTRLEEVIFGEGSLERLPAVLERRDCARALVVTGNSIATKTDYVERLRALLGDRFAGVFAGVREHLPVGTVLAAAEAARDSSADTLIGLGGGSPIDAAKAVANAVAFGFRTAEQLLAGPAERGKTVVFPTVIAIPTTLSAAEYSWRAGVTQPETGVKSAVADERAMPRVAVLDPSVTLATPRVLWASTGIRALDHAVEGVYSLDHTPITDTLGLEAIRMLFRALPASVDQPDAPAHRTDCLVAAWMSHFASATVHFSVSHALGRQLGARYGVGHGITSCLLLAPTMRFLAPYTAERQALLAPAMGVVTRGMSAEQAAAAAADAVTDFVRRLELPTRLREVGATDDDGLRAVAAAAFPLAQRSSPRPLAGPDDLLEVLRAAI